MARFRCAAFGLVCGLIFALGLVLAGMTDPARILGFLDFAGDWDPRLAFVMLGAVAVHFTGELYDRRPMGSDQVRAESCCHTTRCRQ